MGSDVAAPGADLVPILRLARQPLTLDVVELLAQRPATFRIMRTRLRAKSRQLAAALRVLAAYELISRPDQSGTWDEPTGSTCYRLTCAGDQVTQQLERFDVWVAIYQQLLDNRPESPDGTARPNDL